VTHPIHAELAQLLRKTAGLVDVLREALDPLGSKVELAFVYGSMASGTERAASDVDLMVLGKASFAELAQALATAQTTLQREVNPTLMTEREFARKLAAGDGFAGSVMKGDKLWVKGEEGDLAKPVEDRAPEVARAHGRRGAAAAGSHQPQPARRRGGKHQR
jgi:predicted nucleotidyltransferase